MLASGGVAYADNEWTGANIVDGSLTAADLAANSVGTSEVATNSLSASDLAANSVGTSELANNSVSSVDIINGSITGADVNDGSLTGADVLDFGLNNRDVGVLFGQMNGVGAVTGSHDGSVTGFQIGGFGPGLYEMDFGFDITGCAFTGTLGDGDLGTSPGEISLADRSGNPNAVFVQTMDSAGANADRDFTVTVVC